MSDEEPSLWVVIDVTGITNSTTTAHVVDEFKAVKITCPDLLYYCLLSCVINFIGKMLVNISRQLVQLKLGLNLERQGSGRSPSFLGLMTTIYINMYIRF